MQDLDPALARHVRVVEYEVTDRDGQDTLITLVTTITDWQAAPAAVLASAYHERWQHETANAQFKTKTVRIVRRAVGPPFPLSKLTAS